MVRNFQIYTFGCKVNQYESQLIRERLLGSGYKQAREDRAGLYLVNTCTVTEQADKECYRLINKLSKTAPCSQVIVTGCLVEKNADQIRQICDKIQIIPNRQKALLFGSLPLNISRFHAHQRAFVKIQDGCDNLCSYCKVPLVRGRSGSRNPEEIIAEVGRLTTNGFREIVFTGICLGDYRYGDFDLLNLMHSLQKVKADFRIRLSSIEPQLVTDRLLEIFNYPRICAHLHLPLQSGDDTILKRMNRRYTAREYLSLADRIKKRIKDIAVTTDILAGFPGEEKKHFRNTLRCLEELQPLRTHIFPFSPREGTRAFNFPHRVEKEVIKERVSLLRQLARRCSFRFRKQFLGKPLTVLVESKPEKENGLFCGYSENYIRLSVENARRKDINKLVPVKVTAVSLNHTQGRQL